MLAQMGESVDPSPLARAALSVLGEGGTAPDLVDRFAAVDATIPMPTVERLLHELSGLGLVRVARGTGNDRVYRATSLGQRLEREDPLDRPALLRELEWMRTDLLSTIAHELRTPLTAVRTSVGLLRDPSAAPTAAQRDALLETIERNADRMQRLVGETLDLTRFRAGRIHLQLRRFDAAELARSVVASFPTGAQRLELVAPSGPVSVFGDRRRLEHALVNLVSNARTYSPADTTVTVTVQRVADEVRWTVADEGRGIPEADRARLFERFFVGRSDRSDTREGVGLGLPIALAIVQSHEGRIDVESEVGRGSRFTIAVPEGGPREGGET
jgi:signal transduction histidine kinase